MWASCPIDYLNSYRKIYMGANVDGIFTVQIEESRIKICRKHAKISCKKVSTVYTRSNHRQEAT